MSYLPGAYVSQSESESQTSSMMGDDEPMLPVPVCIPTSGPMIEPSPGKAGFLDLQTDPEGGKQKRTRKPPTVFDGMIRTPPGRTNKAQGEIQALRDSVNVHMQTIEDLGQNLSAAKDALKLKTQDIEHLEQQLMSARDDIKVKEAENESRLGGLERELKQAVNQIKQLKVLSLSISVWRGEANVLTAGRAEHHCREGV
jgi:hypothetical protein